MMNHSKYRVIWLAKRRIITLQIKVMEKLMVAFPAERERLKVLRDILSHMAFEIEDLEDDVMIEDEGFMLLIRYGSIMVDDPTFPLWTNLMILHEIRFKQINQWREFFLQTDEGQWFLAFAEEQRNQFQEVNQQRKKTAHEIQSL